MMTVPAAVPPPVVSRVVDYEPPAVTSGSTPRAVTGRRRSSSGGRHLQPVRRAAPRPSSRERQAAAFADTALRTVLEVIDLRRPPAQLRPLLAAGLVEAVASHRRAAHTTGAAVLRRIRLQATDGDDRTFEVAASYSRGSRLHAIACRVLQTAPPGGGPAWQVVALQIG